MRRRGLTFLAPYRVAVTEEPLPSPAPGQVLVRTLFSGISSGTELLVYRGQAPGDLALDDTLPALSGAFTYPLQYGYAAVGRVAALGPGVSADWQDRPVFAFQPHTSHFVAAPEELLPLPDGLTPEEAVLFPNMETAVTLALDGRPLPGEQVVVFGQGIVGLLLTAVLARLPLVDLITLDLHARRRLISETLGAHAVLDPQAADAMEQLTAHLATPDTLPGADLTYEVSGNPAALEQAIAATGFHGRVVIGSWYGQKRVDLNLGGRFHRSRMRLISSQVSTIAPELSGRWSKARRYQLAWRMLEQLRPAPLLSHRFPLDQAPLAYELLDREPGEVLQVLLCYQ